MKTLKLPGLTDTYTLLQNDTTLAQSGKAADAKVTGQALARRISSSAARHQIVSTMENKWISGSSVVDNTVHLITQILEIDSYMVVTIDSGYQVGVLFYDDGVTDRATIKTSSGFKNSYIALWPGVRAVVCMQKSNNGTITLADLEHLHVFVGYGKPSYSNASYIGGLTSLSKINQHGVYFLAYGIDITNANKGDLPSGYPNNTNALLVVQEYYYAGVKLFQQHLYTVGTPLRHWTRYTKADGTAFNPWTHDMTEPEVSTLLNTSVLAGKKVSFYGDSISTFAGYIPSGNVAWYTGSNCGVSSVGDTWWKKLMDALGMSLHVNNSWSGRFVSSHADTWEGRTTNAGYKQANIDALAKNDTAPDVIVILLGINDFNNEAPIGTYDGTTAVPTDASTFTNGYGIMLDRIMTTYPLARVYCCTLINQDHNQPSEFPEVNGNGVALSTWNEAIRKLAKAFGATVINFDQCGITHYNLETYMGDFGDYGTGEGVHPNADGHSLVANQAIHDMDESVKTRY